LTEQTLLQDRKTKLALTGAREETTADLNKLSAGKHGMSVYMREEHKGLSYNENI